MRRLEALLPKPKGLDSGRCQPRGQKCALDRIRCLAAQEHLLDSVDLTAEEVRRFVMVNIHESRERLASPLQTCREGEIINETFEQEDRGFQPVSVLVAISDRLFFEESRDILGSWQVVPEAFA